MVVLSAAISSLLDELVSLMSLESRSWNWLLLWLKVTFWIIWSMLSSNFFSSGILGGDLEEGNPKVCFFSLVASGFR